LRPASSTTSGRPAPASIRHSTRPFTSRAYAALGTRTGNGPQVMATLLAIAIFKLGGATNIAAACRHHSRDAARTLAAL
jgi:hypothetical protein